MENVAKRYALALLSIAKDENKVQEYINQIEEIINIFKENEELLILLSSYGISNIEKKDCLKKCFENNIYDYILNLFYVLIDNKRIEYLLDVCQEFVKIALESLAIKKGVVYSTITLNEKQIQKLENKVSKIINMKVILTNVIDKSLIGGFKIQIDDYVIEDSLKKRLETLKENLFIKKEGSD